MDGRPVDLRTFFIGTPEVPDRGGNWDIVPPWRQWPNPQMGWWSRWHNPGLPPTVRS